MRVPIIRKVDEREILPGYHHRPSSRLAARGVGEQGVAVHLKLGADEVQTEAAARALDRDKGREERCSRSARPAVGSASRQCVERPTPRHPLPLPAMTEQSRKSTPLSREMIRDIRGQTICETTAGRLSGRRIVQSEIGHAPYRYPVLLVSSEAPGIRVLKQDDPNEQSEAVAGGLPATPAGLGVNRLPGCSYPVVPGHHRPPDEKTSRLPRGPAGPRGSQTNAENCYPCNRSVVLPIYPVAHGTSRQTGMPCRPKATERRPVRPDSAYCSIRIMRYGEFLSTSSEFEGLFLSN